MTLTQDDLNILKAPFPVSEHEFDFKNNVYIQERPICERIEQVDPGWQLDEPKIQWRDGIGGKVCEVSGTMTIKGVTRGGVGQSSVVSNKAGDDEANQAAKSAATDWLKRTARLFGVGRYLLDTPKYVKDSTTLDKWLSQSRGVQSGKPTQSTDSPQSSENGQNSGSTDNQGSSTIEDGTVKQVEIIRIEVDPIKSGPNAGKPFRKIITNDEAIIGCAFDRSVFRNRGWVDPDSADDMNIVGQRFQLNKPVPGQLIMKKGFWHLQDIAEFLSFEGQGGLMVNITQEIPF